MSFFRKLRHGANRLFHKLDHGASTFFTKTVPHLGHVVGNGIQDAGNQVAGVGKKVGNFLEKNSGIISDAVAGVSMALGQPELAALALTGGNIGQNVGQKLNQGSSRLKSISNIANNSIKSNLTSNNMNNLVSSAKNQAQQNLQTLQGK
jgi:hypothetical protein